MNEFLFFAHILALLGASALALRMGKYALVALTGLEVVLSNLFVTKEIALFSLHVTPTDAYTLGSLVGINVLRECFGKDVANKAVYSGIFLLLFFVVMSFFQTSYAPTSSDALHESFAQILTLSPRIFLASLAAFFISQRIDLELFSRLRKRLSFPLSMGISLSISQALDTVLFSYMGLYGVVESIFSIIAFSYAIKMIGIATMAPLTSFVRRAHAV